VTVTTRPAPGRPGRPARVGGCYVPSSPPSVTSAAGLSALRLFPCLDEPPTNFLPAQIDAVFDGQPCVVAGRLRACAKGARADVTDGHFYYRRHDDE